MSTSTKSNTRRKARVHYVYLSHYVFMRLTNQKAHCIYGSLHWPIGHKLIHCGCLLTITQYGDRLMIKDTCIYTISWVFWRVKINNAQHLKGVVMFESSIVKFFYVSNVLLIHWTPFSKQADYTKLNVSNISLVKLKLSLFLQTDLSI
jgi:hypothetical protein